MADTQDGPVWVDFDTYSECKFLGYVACVFPSAFGIDSDRWGVLVGYGLAVLNSARESFDTEAEAKARAIVLMRQYFMCGEKGKYT